MLLCTVLRRRTQEVLFTWLLAMLNWMQFSICALCRRFVAVARLLCMSQVLVRTAQEQQLVLIASKAEAGHLPKTSSRVEVSKIAHMHAESVHDKVALGDLHALAIALRTFNAS